MYEALIILIIASCISVLLLGAISPRHQTIALNTHPFRAEAKTSTAHAYTRETGIMRNPRPHFSRLCMDRVR